MMRAGETADEQRADLPALSLRADGDERHAEDARPHLRRAAARARVQRGRRGWSRARPRPTSRLYVLQLDMPEIEASPRRTSPSRGEDREVLRDGLDRLAGLAKGEVFRVGGNADFAFQRLSVELSGYYLLSFEPQPGDRDGKPHKIKIDIRRKDLTLRSRREFSVGAAGPRPAEESARRDTPGAAARDRHSPEAHDLHVPGHRLVEAEDHPRGRHRPVPQPRRNGCRSAT